MAIENQKPVLLYVFDPLCGWCYGFSPVIVELKKEYNDKINFDIISGGMVTGDRIGPLSKMADYIRSAYKTVEVKTGVKFGEKYINGTLNDETALQTSIPSSELLVAFKQLDIENRAIEFAHRLQLALFYEGIQSDDYLGLAQISKEFDIEPNDLLTLAKSDDIEKLTLADFELSSNLRVSGFPTVFLHIDDTLNIIARGAEKLEDLKARIDSLLQ